MHKYCIIVRFLRVLPEAVTCTCTRSCKISDYQHLGLTRRSTQLATGSAKIPAHRPTSMN